MKKLKLILIILIVLAVIGVLISGFVIKDKIKEVEAIGILTDEVDMQKVIAAAADTGTALEINAQPERMDLDEKWARAAKEKGVKLVISTDSHQMANFAFMKLGVFVARRAWCTASDILNTHSWKEVHAFAQKKKELVAA